MSEAQDFKYIGQRTVRPDGFDKVTGRANYAADFALPGMIWGRILLNFNDSGSISVEMFVISMIWG